MKTKKPSDSYTETTHIVLPNDTNTLGNLMGGRLLYSMDIAAAIAAGRHSNRVVVTASVDSVDFKAAIKLGEIVILQAVVTRAFTTSMEVRIDVYAENPTTAVRRHCNAAYYTFVAIDQMGSPLPVNKIEPETEREKELYEGAVRRREFRLEQAGKFVPEIENIG